MIAVYIYLLLMPLTIHTNAHEQASKRLFDAYAFSRQEKNLSPFQNAFPQRKQAETTTKQTVRRK